MHTIEVEALFFDLDGVLVDVSRSYRRAIEETVEQFTNRRIPPGTIQHYKNMGGFNDDWKLTHAIVTNAGVHVPFSRIVEAFQQRYRGRNWDGFIAEEPCIIETATLESLHANLRVMGIVTGRPEAEAQWTVERFGWKKYFPLIVAREEQGHRPKPDAFPLQRALAVLGETGPRIRPEMAAYVGDTVDDVACARGAGTWAIGFIPPSVRDKPELNRVLLERGAHVVIERLDDLATLLDGSGRDATAHDEVDTVDACPDHDQHSHSMPKETCKP